jgi:hypothetical protein
LHVGELRNELRVARLHASRKAMSEAERHLRVALELIGEAPPDSLSRAIRSYVTEAGFAITQSNSRLVVSSLHTALRLLDKKSGVDG